MRKYLFLLLCITGITAMLTVTTLSVRLWAAHNPADQLLYLSQADATRGNVSNLYVYDLRTATQHALVTDFLGWGADAAWSPQGDRIAFSMFEDGIVERNIHILDVVSGEVERITGDSSTTDHNSPSWSPDGTRLAYHAFDLAVGPNTDIYTYDLRGSTQLFFYGTEIAQLTPVWLPDGQSLLFVSISSDRGDYYTEIMSFNSASGESEQLSHAIANPFQPALSPAGDQYAFTDLDSSYSGSTIGIASLEGTALTPIAQDQQGAQAEPVWSPDGEWIAYTNFEPGGSRIYKIRPDGGAPVVITPAGESYRQPHWRP